MTDPLSLFYRCAVSWGRYESGPRGINTLQMRYSEPAILSHTARAMAESLLQVGDRGAIAEVLPGGGYRVIASRMVQPGMALVDAGLLAALLAAASTMPPEQSVAQCTPHPAPWK